MRWRSRIHIRLSAAAIMICYTTAAHDLGRGWNLNLIMHWPHRNWVVIGEITILSTSIVFLVAVDIRVRNSICESDISGGLIQI